MKIRILAVMAISSALCLPALANECTETCEQEYQDCKAVAESATAKQACDDDVAQCKADCQ